MILSVRVTQRLLKSSSLHISLSIHAMRKSTIPRCRSAGMAAPRGIFRLTIRSVRASDGQTFPYYSSRITRLLKTLKL